MHFRKINLIAYADLLAFWCAGACAGGALTTHVGFVLLPGLLCFVAGVVMRARIRGLG